MVVTQTIESENKNSWEDRNKSLIGTICSNPSNYNNGENELPKKVNGCTCGVQSCDYCIRQGRHGISNNNGWRRFNKRKIICLIVLSSANFFVAVTYSLLAPFYPEEAQSKGATATEFGLVFGIFELVAFLTSPVFGIYVRIMTHCGFNAQYFTFLSAH